MFVEKTLDGMWGIKDLFLIFERSHISNNNEPSNVSSVFAASGADQPGDRPQDARLPFLGLNTQEPLEGQAFCPRSF